MYFCNYFQTIDEENSDDSENETLSQLLPQAAPITSSSSNRARRPYCWKKKAFIAPNFTFSGSIIQPPDNQNLKSSYEYFQQFVTLDMINNLVKNTNLYSVQKSGTNIKTNKKKLNKSLVCFFLWG